MKKPTVRNMSSSIFDSFEPTLNDSKVIKSSIFDNFDVSHSKPSSSMSTSVQMESFIFDSYESTVKPKPYDTLKPFKKLVNHLRINVTLPFN